MNSLEELKTHLKTGVAEIHFLKVSGAERTMLCTLRDDLLPPTKNSGRKKNPDVTVVFDLEANDWRSFRNIGLLEYKLLGA